MTQRDHLHRPGVDLGEDDRGVVGVGPRGLEDALLEAAGSDPGHSLRQLHRGKGGVEGGDMAEAVDLSLDRPGHPGFAMAHRDGEDTPEEVQVPGPVHVLQVQAVPALEDHRLGVVVGHRRHQVLPVFFPDLGRGVAGDQQASLFGQGHMSDDWWRSAANHPLLDIGNHGWDHNHPDLAEEHHSRGGFTVIDTLEHCRRQVVQAGEFIQGITGQWPQVFAYPFGESSDYIRDEFFPEYGNEHHSVAALGTQAGLVSAQSNRWDLPRFVCGRDWSSPGELLATLGF